MTQQSIDLTEVHENADDWWKDSAGRAIKWLAETGTPFEAFDVTELGVPDSDHPSRWGAAFQKAARAGIIQHYGYANSRRPTRHGGITRLWIGTNKESGPGAVAKLDTESAEGTNH